MRFIPPAQTSSEETLSAIIDLISNKDEYKKKLDALKKQKKEVSDAIKEHDTKLEKIESYEKEQVAREDRINKQAADIDSKKVSIAEDQRSLRNERIQMDTYKQETTKALEDKVKEVEKTRRASVTEKNRIDREGVALEQQQKSLANAQAKLEADKKAFEDKQARLKLLMAS